MTHTEARELMAPYSLGTLEGNELAAMEEHLAGCAFCASLAAEAGEVVEHLAFAAPSRRPPSSGLERLLSEVAETQQTAALGRLSEQQPAMGWLAAKQPAEHGRRHLRWLSRPSLPRLRSPLPVVAALVLALGLGVWNLFLVDHLKSERAEMDELKGRVTSQSELLFLMTSNEIVSRELQASSFAPYAKVRVLIDAGNNKAVVMASRLPQPAAGWFYQVWLGAAESRFPAGRLVVDEQGDGECSLSLPAGAGSYDSAWITLEPQSGTPPPVSTGVAQGKL